MDFCTLFNRNYLSRGLALYESLRRHVDDFRLFVFAFDDDTAEVLDALDLPKLVTIPLTDFEDGELLRVKGSRSPVEYCWTSTSSTILYVLEQYDSPLCTYVDADVYFFADPSPLLQELSDDSVLLTEHRYTPRYDRSRESGTYCVQFTAFRNDERGLRALRWWRDSCIEWCYARHEDGKFGDQKYLDDWLDRFEGVHVLEHPGGGLAPWNVQQYDIYERDGSVWCRSRKSGGEFPVVFYHFHALRFLTPARVDFWAYRLDEDDIHLLYRPYVADLVDQGDRVKAIRPDIDPHAVGPAVPGWKAPVHHLKRIVKGTRNIRPVSSFIEKS